MGFTEILGHRDVLERLGRLAHSERMGHAYLFLGPQGVGRKRTAVAWAKVLNCTEPLAGYPHACGLCSACRKIDHGRFPDLFIVESEDGKTLKIDAVREVVRESHYRPFEGKKRVFVIDNAELMNDAAANALLKTLEEPPSTLVLVLIAEHEGQLLPTIKSRCQIVRFGSLPLDIVVSELVKKDVSETDARWLAGAAAGSLGRAEEALAQRGEMKALRDELFAGLDTLAVDPIAAFRLAEKYKKPDVALPALRMLKSFFRDVVVFKTGKREGVVNVDHSELVTRHAEARPIEEHVERFTAVERAERLMTDFNANKHLVLERLLQELT